MTLFQRQGERESDAKKTLDDSFDLNKWKAVGLSHLVIRILG